MYRENYINSLREELLDMVADKLTPVALRYGYSDAPLETNIKWRPLVLVLGNYSSGKSALINEFLGADIQVTGQAPTDDSFTVITYDNSVPAGGNIQITEERDGKFLLNDPEYPFDSMRKHGQRFAAHFRLKKVNSPFLKTLAIIDTPGMLDSITERDRGYNYQDVVGDLAQIADLILVLFDPHKAGTIREAHISLRDTLPSRTFEDRVLYVLNRIDECASLGDLIRVYGTLCWNLSQITGRKDIPMIHLTYSPRAAAESNNGGDLNKSYLPYLENQREYLKRAILQAPRHRLDHLATFVETHGERLSHFLEALINYRRGLGKFRFKFSIMGILFSLLFGMASASMLFASESFAGFDQRILYGAGSFSAVLFLFFWLTLLMRFFSSRYHRSRMKQLDELTPLENQTRRDSWQTIRDLAYSYLDKTAGKFPIKDVKKDYASTLQVYDKGAREIREALSELSSMTKNKPISSRSSSARRT
jgi:hypothetical protein